MKVEYLPDTGFKIESKEIRWGEKREVIRKILPGKFRQDDGTLDNASFFDGDTSYNISYRRDLYENVTATYDGEDCLKELEMFGEENILVLGITLVPGGAIHECIDALRAIGHEPRIVKEGEFFYERLKMVIATSESMGGEGKGLGYFYAGREVSHVVEEYDELENGI